MSNNQGTSGALDQAGAEALAALKPSNEREDKSVEEVLKTFTRTQLAQILDRGVVNDRLAVKLPPDRVGYWVRERPDDIERYLNLHGRIESSKEIGQQGLHGTGDDRIRVGDCILMSLPKQVVEAIADHDEMNKLRLRNRGKEEFLKNKVEGVPHYSED